MRRIISNQSGSIFMIGLITALIAAIVSFAILAYALNYKQYAERNVFQGDFNALSAQVYSMIEQPGDCKRAFGVGITPELISPPRVVGSVHPVRIFFPGTLNQFVGPAAPNFGKLNTLSAQIRILEAGLGTTGLGYFGKLELSSNMPLGVYSKTTGEDLYISFMVTGATNRIETCSGVTFRGTSGTIHGVKHCGNGERLWSDGADLYCRVGMCWGATPTRTGFDVNGVATCSP